jgi:hypothetical protein
MGFTKTYVDVILRQDREGKTHPLSLVFGDTTYEIDRIKNVQRAAATKVGGTGIRYTIVVSGKESFLFEDGGSGLWRLRKKLYET